VLLLVADSAGPLTAGHRFFALQRMDADGSKPEKGNRAHEGEQILNDDTLNLIYGAVDDVNAQSADGPKIAKNEDSRLLGGGSGLDSLTFVNLIVAIEGQLEPLLGKAVLLIDDDNLSLMEDPFRTIGTLRQYVEKVIERAQAA
jgi:D-alanine--poly(phosphoribitol) ligase subunit 2